MSAIPTWVFTLTTIALIAFLGITVVKTEGGIKRPAQLLIITIVTVVYLFSLTFIQGAVPQLGLDLKGGVSVVLEAKGNPSADQISIAADIIRDRVDSLGAGEPEIFPQGKNIIVDLPGAKDARKAQELIGQTAELRFREVAENQGTDPQLQQVLQQVTLNESSKAKIASKKTTTTVKKTTTTTAATTTTQKQTGSAGQSFRAASSTTTSTPESTTPESSAPKTSGQITSVNLQCGGTNPVTVTMTGDLSHATAREDDHANKPIIALDKQTRQAYALCPAVLSGDIVKTASRQVDATGTISVGVELTGKGGKAFTEKIGRPLSNQSVAIVLDSEVISAPTIQPSLADGLTNNQLQITVGGGKQQKSEVDNLVTVLKYGSLPVVLVQQTAEKISPTLGTDQLHAGLIAGAVGLLLVMIYMILYYRILASVVFVGLLLSGMTTYAIVSWTGTSGSVSLTIAGVVGLIISLGVTVDSYVVYFEKLKDEVKLGRSVRSCLDAAFKSSFKTIFAADLVSFFGAVTLYLLAAGSVRGFALFLGISVVLDLILTVCFMHPMVKLIATRKSLITNRYMGMGAALDKRDLVA